MFYCCLHMLQFIYRRLISRCFGSNWIKQKMQRALFRPTMLLLGRGCVTRGRSTTVRRPSKKVETPRRSLLRVGAKKSSFAHHRVGVALKRAVKPSAAPRRRGRPPKNATAKKASTRVAKTKRTRRMKRQAKMKHDASAAVASVCVEPSVESRAVQALLRDATQRMELFVKAKKFCTRTHLLRSMMWLLQPVLMEHWVQSHVRRRQAQPCPLPLMTA